MSTLTGHHTATNPQQRHRKEAQIPLFIDASALARAPAHRRSPARCGSTTAAGPCTPPTGPTIARCRSASWSRGASDDVIATIDVCRQHGAPILSRGGGTSLTGGCCNVAVVMDWSKYLNNVLWVDPGAEARAGAAGLRARQAPRRGREAQPDLRARPLHPQPLHPGRDDRQQFVRRPLADRPRDRPDLRPGRRAGDHALRRDPDDRRPDQR